jgi:hypothetical protein
VIIQLRGTSGSGKSTLMKALMKGMGPWTPFYEDGRKKPLFYYNAQDWVVLGHYESACGGCDTIGSAAEVYTLWSKLAGGTFNGNPRNFLMEGLLLSEDVKWTTEMDRTDVVRAMFLATDVEVCINQIKKRRSEVGNAKPLNENNTRNRVPVITRAQVRLVEAGVICRRAVYLHAFGIVRSWINNSPTAE